MSRHDSIFPALLSVSPEKHKLSPSLLSEEALGSRFFWIVTTTNVLSTEISKPRAVRGICRDAKVKATSGIFKGASNIRVDEI